MFGWLPTVARGVELAEREIPDAIIMDYYLPDRNGLETCHILKRNPRTKDIPIIFVTIVQDGYTILQFYDAEAGFLSKPVGAKQIIDELRNILQSKNQKPRNF